MQSWFQWLRDAVFDCLPLSVGLAGDFTPPGWTNRSVVEFAWEAINLKFVPASSLDAMRDVIRDFSGVARVSYSHAPALGEFERRSNGPSFQRMVQVILTKHLDCNLDVIGKAVEVIVP